MPLPFILILRSPEATEIGINLLRGKFIEPNKKSNRILTHLRKLGQNNVLYITEESVMLSHIKVKYSRLRNKRRGTLINF